MPTGLNDIVNPSALLDAMQGDWNLITLLGPFIFLSFAIAVHHLWEQRPFGWIGALLLLLLTLAFDAILAVQISQKIHQANILIGQEKGEWNFEWFSLNIWTVIFCGFVVSVLVSIVYHVTWSRLGNFGGKGRRRLRGKRLKTIIKLEKNLVQQGIVVLEAEMQNLQEEISRLTDKVTGHQAEIEKAQIEIDALEAQVKRVKVADRDNMESQVNQFLNGWLRYVTHSGAGKTK